MTLYVVEFWANNPELKKEASFSALLGKARKRQTR